MSTRKFYKSVFQIVVLSEEPIGPDIDVEDLVYEITEGECSGSFSMVSSAELDGEACAVALIQQHSDPGFFNLDEDGNDTEDPDYGEPDEEED